MNVRIEEITIYGTEKTVEMVQQILRARLPTKLFRKKESDARLLIQSLIDANGLERIQTEFINSMQ